MEIELLKNPPKETTLQVHPPCGPVLGEIKKEISVFKGIPYAEPPINENRFRPPQKKKPWETPLECFEFGPKCLQFGGILADLTSMYSIEGKSEDCLYLTSGHRQPPLITPKNIRFMSISTAVVLPPDPVQRLCLTEPVWQNVASSS